MRLFLFVLVVIVLAIASFVLFAPQFGKKPHGEHLELIKKSPQHDEKLFQNVSLSSLSITLAESVKMLAEMFQGGENRQPKSELPSEQPTFDKTEGAHLTWFGHSTFLYEIDGKKILFDPMLGKYASPVPFMVARYPYKLPATAKDLPKLDAVIISHDHYDHLDYETIKILKDKVDRFIMPLGVGSHLGHWGVPKEKITELDWWDETKIADITIAATPSQHFSGRSLDDRQHTLWASWMIKSETVNVFFSGDTGYSDAFKKIGDKYGPFDLTLLDSGQYNERWAGVHMFPEESVIAHKDLKGKTFMPIHWSAFTLAFHDWDAPAEKAVAAAEKEQIDMVTPMIGQRFNVLTDKPKEFWWRGY